MVKEKEQGTVSQVYTSDLSSVEWLLGKELAYLIIGLGEAAIVMTVATLLFGLRIQGDPTTLLVGTVIYLGASVAFGLLVGARASNQTGAVQRTAIAGFLTALLLSGFIYRIENIPFRCRHCLKSFRPATLLKSPVMSLCEAPDGRAFGTPR